MGAADADGDDAVGGAVAEEEKEAATCPVGGPADGAGDAVTIFFIPGGAGGNFFILGGMGGSFFMLGGIGGSGMMARATAYRRTAYQLYIYLNM